MIGTKWLVRLKERIIALLAVPLLFWIAYYCAWGRYLYLATAYCNCSICVNVKAYQDDFFASGKKLYWGALAADPAVRFGTKVELMPVWPSDFSKIRKILKNRRQFTVEDRGGMIKGKHIDLFIPDDLGGHAAARRWGRQWMRVKFDGKWAT